MYCIYYNPSDNVDTRKRFTIASQMLFSLLFSLRAIYGTDDLRNAVHGSLRFSSAEREIRFMFPEGKMLLIVDCK